MQDYETLKISILLLEKNDIVTLSDSNNDVDVGWQPGWNATPGWHI